MNVDKIRKEIEIRIPKNLIGPRAKVRINQVVIEETFDNFECLNLKDDKYVLKESDV